MKVLIAADDYLAAIRLSMKPRPLLLALGGLLLVLALLALGLAASAALQGRADWNDLLSALAITFLPAWYWLYLPWRVRRLYQQQRSLHEPYSVTMDDDTGLHFQTTNGQARLPWEHIHRWRESRSLFVLHESDALIHILPKRFFDETLSEDRLRSALRERAVR